MKITIAAGLFFLSLLQVCAAAVVLLWGIDSPLIVAASTLAIAGPLTYFAERKKHPKKTRMFAWQSSSITTILASLFAMYLSSQDFNHYHAVCYACFSALGVVSIGVTKATERVLRIVAQGLVDVFKRNGWLDDD